MENLQNSLKQKSTGIPRWLIISWIVIALIGFIDSTYLTVEHFQDKGVTCSLSGQCGQVLNSEYATIGPIPVAILGALYYLLMFIGGIYYNDKKNEKVMKLLAKFSVAGLIASAYLFYLQAFVINAYCQFCLLSAGTSTILFILGIIFLQKFKSNNLPTKQDGE